MFGRRGPPSQDLRVFGNGGERFVDAAARASGGEAHDLVFKTFAALPQKRPHTDNRLSPVKPLKAEPIYGAIFVYRRTSIKTWARATFAWTKTKI